MNRKFLFGVAIAGAALFTVYVLKDDKKNEKNVGVIELDDDGNPIQKESEEATEEADTSLKAKIKKKIKEKEIDKKIAKAVGKIVGFLLKYKEELEAVTAGFTLFTALLKLKEAMSVLNESKKDLDTVSLWDVIDGVKNTRSNAIISDDANRGYAWTVSYGKEVVA